MTLGAVALAGIEDGYGGDPTVPLQFAFEDIVPPPRHDRGYDIEVGVRVRSVSVPKGFLDRRYFDEEDPNYAYFEPRPRLSGIAIGLETVVKSNGSNGLFYVEYIDSATPGGYWDDREDPADHLDGDYISPSAGLGIIAAGANYAYEVHLLQCRKTGGRFGLSILAGGGLGLGVLGGRLDSWGPDNNGNPGYKRYLDGEAPDGDLGFPRVVPMIDVSGGTRLTFGDRVALRFEGGLHTAVFYGTSLGVVF